MKNLNVKVGDKGAYAADRTPCEVVYVKSSGYFVTSSQARIPQVHEADGVNLDACKAQRGAFDFIPAPKKVRVAVWLNKNDESCSCVVNENDSVLTNGTQYLTFEVPR